MAEPVWTPVQVDGKDTFEITKEDKWKKTLINLPVAEIVKGSDGQDSIVYNLYFRAVEVEENSEGTKAVKGALNYKMTSDLHTFDDNNINKSKITNTLTHADQSTITVKKKWYKTSTVSKTAEFELLYRKAGETDWHCYDAAGTKVDVNNLTKQSHPKTDACRRKELQSTTNGVEQTITWENLPKFDREGNLLEYKV